MDAFKLENVNFYVLIKLLLFLLCHFHYQSDRQNNINILDVLKPGHEIMAVVIVHFVFIEIFITVSFVILLKFVSIDGVLIARHIKIILTFCALTT